MDIKPFASGIIAIIASLVTGLSLLYGQVVVQEHEDLRHLRMLAYQSALEEWKVQTETMREAKCYEYLPQFSDILLQHIEYSYVVNKYGADKESRRYAGVILDAMMENMKNRQKNLLPPATPGNQDKADNSTETHPKQGAQP
jgi:hypothetical protein